MKEEATRVSLKKKDMIVITIETCDKRSCHMAGKVDSGKGNLGDSPSGKSKKSACICLSSNDQLSFCDKNTCEFYQKNKAAKEALPQEGDKPEIKITSPSGDVHAEEAQSVEAVERDPSSREVTDQASHQTVDKPPPSEGDDHKKQVLYKLPIVTERHHGPGCAMEISVLEKHEGACQYRKEENEGRTIDDKVGSYDCIGRIVFRTCTSSDESSSPSLKHSPTGPAVESSDDTSKQSSQSQSNVGSKPSKPSPTSNIVIHDATPADSPPEIQDDAPRPRSTVVLAGDDDDKHSKISQTPSQSSKAPDSDQPKEDEIKQVMTALNRFPKQKLPPKKYYPGDSCRKNSYNLSDYFHNPSTLDLQNIVNPKDLKTLAASKKTFTTFIDQANQVPSNVFLPFRRASQETITSLTDLMPKRKTKDSSKFISFFKKKSRNNSPERMAESTVKKTKNKDDRNRSAFVRVGL